MKKFMAVCISFAIVCGIITGIIGLLSIEKIDVGNVGVIYSMSEGVEEDVLSTGYHFISPFKKVKEFPVSQQQIVFSNNPSDYNEKEHADWSIDAPADGGMVTLNLSVNYNFIAEKVTSLYENFGGMDGEQIVESRVQNQIIAYVKNVTPKFTVMEIYSEKRSEVGQAISEYLTKQLMDEYGIEVSSVSIIDVQLDTNLMAKIKAKEEAKQEAEKAELDLITAQKVAETNKVKAEGEAQVKVIEAKAEAEANKLISNSITQNLIDMKEAEARLKHGWVEIQGASTVVRE